MGKVERPYWFEYASASNVDIRNIPEFLLGDLDEVLKIGPLRHVTFLKNHIFLIFQKLVSLRRELNVCYDHTRIFLNGKTCECKIDT